MKTKKLIEDLKKKIEESIKAKEYIEKNKVNLYKGHEWDYWNHIEIRVGAFLNGIKEGIEAIKKDIKTQIMFCSNSEEAHKIEGLQEAVKILDEALK